jgi:diguanylate cyclase
VARFGGEEFVIILPGTSLDTARAVVERIRKSLAEKQLVRRQTGENMGAITASFGIAKLNDDDSADSLVDRADRCLYAAKNAGRNRVETDAEEVGADGAAVGENRT